ncbi:hypothetical protein [Clostridium sp. HBUAS56010]|uniref:hypothetical protein n=1 Tax=Clostridium sp. HBUAS56010 TaxID=2571127 RepID=UPI001177551A|nr:hypothetical protein [Clostridium sp. HBUAS56010]
MKAKEYLSQLEQLDQKIKHKKQELIEAKRNRGISTAGTETGKIQTTLAGSSGKQTESQALKVVSLEEIIESQIIEYMELKHKYIDQIHDLKDGLYIDVLYRRYIRGEKNFTQIACDMGYSYKHIINKHGEALIAFEKSHQDLFENEAVTDGKLMEKF